MHKKRQGRLSLRDLLEKNNRALRMWGAAFGKPEVAEKLANVIPEKRHRIKRPNDGQPSAPLEKEIQGAILDALALRRDIVFVGRFNRGQAVNTYNGNTSYTEFNTVPGFPDIHGLLLGGRAFYIEVKRPPPNYRRPEAKQQEFLDNARNAGACAGVATSVEEAMALLPVSAPI